MINIHPTSMLGLMMLAHLVADYTLQGCLADLKQRNWWRIQMDGLPQERKEKYRNDYKMALACHALYWSLIVCLPLLTVTGSAYILNAIIQGAIHYGIDDAKANKATINLVTDQLLHFAQIVAVWVAWILTK